jgi:hypothetical protein
VLLSHHLAINIIGAAGRTPTRIVPIRSRMPRVFGHGSALNGRQAGLSADAGKGRSSTSRDWSERQDFHLRPPGPRPGALKTELRSDKFGGSEGTCTLSLPADNGLLWLVELRIQKLVGGAGNAPVVTSDNCLRHRFYRPAAGTPPKVGSGGGSRAHRG